MPVFPKITSSLTPLPCLYLVTHKKWLWWYDFSWGTFVTFVSRNWKKPCESSWLEDWLTLGTNSRPHKYEAAIGNHFRYYLANLWLPLCSRFILTFSISVTGSPYIWRVILIPLEWANTHGGCGICNRAGLLKPIYKSFQRIPEIQASSISQNNIWRREEVCGFIY